MLHGFTCSMQVGWVIHEINIILILFYFWFADWLAENDDDIAFEQLNDELLAEKLKRFYGELCKRDGEPYSRSSLRNIRAGLNRHLTSAPVNRTPPINLVTHKTFRAANDVILGAIKELKEQGKDTTEHKPVIEHADADKLYSSGVLSDRPQHHCRTKFFF